MTEKKLLKRLQEKTTVDWTRHEMKGNTMLYNDTRIMVLDGIMSIYGDDWWDKAKNITTEDVPFSLDIPISMITDIIWHDMISAMSIETIYSYSYFVQF